MKSQSPYRLHFILFLAISVIAIAQLGWWVIFQVQEGGRVSAIQTAIWVQEKNIARTYFDSEDIAEAGQSSWLKANFPDLQLNPVNGDLQVTSEATNRLNELAHKRVRMFISEGAFFSLLVLTGLWFFYWALRKRIELEYRTANILGAASSGLQKPIAIIRNDIDSLSKILNTDPAGEDFIKRIKSGVQEIADSCENVSLVRMLSASKRKLELKLVDIADLIESSVNDYKSSHSSPDRQVIFDLEKNLSAVTNPQQLSKIVGGILYIAGNYDGGNGTIEINLSKAGQSAVLKTSCRPAKNGVNGESVLKEIESRSAIIKELAETIAAKVHVQAGDENNYELLLELPLFED